MSARIVPLFGLNQQGKSRTVTVQRHLNLYAEIQPGAEKSPVVFYGTPGTTLRKSFGDTPVRGWIAIDDLYYMVHRGTLYSVNNAGTATSLGTLNTVAGFVDMAYDGTRILMVDGTNGYTFTISGSTFAQILDADFPNGANTCTWLDGQFVVDDGDGSEQFFISPTGTAWDALDFASAESNPDGLVRVFADNGEVVLLGANTTEFWGNIGEADFPFAAIKGSTQEYGLAARLSLCKFNSGLAALMKTSMGQVQVMFISGYVPKPVSSQELDSIINGYATVSDATAYAYMLGGHPMLQINFPSVMKSWLYDASTNLWSPLEYGLEGGRHRGEMQLDYLNKTIIADYATGDIYNLSADTYTDNGVAIARELIGRHIFKGDEEMTIDRLYVDFETGVGLSGNPEDSGTNYLNLPGASGDYASTPDSAALDITGDIEIIVYAAADDWTPASASMVFIAKSTNTGNQRSYRLRLTQTTGTLAVITSVDGAATIVSISTVATGFVDGTGHWVRATVDVDNGAGGNTVTFYTSDDAEDTAIASISWTQLGAAVVNAGTTSIFSSSAELTIGAHTAGTLSVFDGKIYVAYIYNGIGGTLAALFDARTTPTGATSILSTTGETYTVQGAASITGDYVGATAGANPQAVLQISVDNGHTFGNELWTNMGAIGKYLTRAVWRRLGMALDFVFKIRVADPVKVVITYGALEYEND